MSNKSIDTIVVNPPKQVTAPLFSASELQFISLVAKDYSLVTAYRKAFPNKKDLSYNTIRRYASELYAKSNIQYEVATTREKQARLARLSEDRIEEVLTDGDISKKENKVADVAMFMYEQANGKATQKIEQRSAHVLVTYNLGGTDTPPIPDEVLAQLK